VQGGSVVVAAEVVPAEGKLGQRVRAVHHHLHPGLAAHPADLGDGEDLAGEIGHVGDEEYARARGERLAESGDELGRGRGGDGERDRPDHDALAPLALAERGQRSRVVLVGGEHLVARLQIEPEQDRLQRLAGVAGDGDLLRVTAEQRGQARADDLHLRLQHRPHRVGGGLVGPRLVAPQGLLHQPRRRRHAAVVEVHDAGIDVEGGLDDVPQLFVRRRLFRGPPLEPGDRLPQGREGGVASSLTFPIPLRCLRGRRRCDAHGDG
jgi:hypothetical protein